MKKKIYAKKRFPIVVCLRPNTTVTGNHSNYIYVVSLGHGKNRRLPIVVNITVAKRLLLQGKIET